VFAVETTIEVTFQMPGINLKPGELPRREFYRVLISCVVPRPIAWVSTVDAAGAPNLAPYSFFNALCGSPPLLGFCPGLRSKDLRDAMGSAVKDTLRNVRETGEFVVSVVAVPLAEAMNLTAGEYDSSIDEFALAKLTTRPSQCVKPPQVAESPVSFECKVQQIVDFGTETDGGSLVIGEIVCAHLSDDVLRDGRLDPQLVDLVGRMGGSQYCLTRERFEMIRPDPVPSAK
jgi:flavin reductase (DIM6/NTAB) family NADH-FMN oxidoreductase RutF